MDGSASRSRAGVRERLRAALPDARKRRDAVAIEALRSALAAIDNAEAVVPPAAATTVDSRHIAGSAGGLRAGEARRAELSEGRIRTIVDAEIDERRTAADACDAHGRQDAAADLRAGADVLSALLA